MVLYKNATVSVIPVTITKNKHGTKIKEFDYNNPSLSFRADVQPNTLSEAEVKLYGLSEAKARTKKVFFDIKYTIADNCRVRVVTDEGEDDIYTVGCVNRWRTHSEVLLIPVEHE